MKKFGLDYRFNTLIFSELSGFEYTTIIDHGLQKYNIFILR